MLLQLTCTAACAARSGAADETFRAMQVHEASLAQAEARLTATPCAPDSPADVEQVCRASRSLCGLGEELSDRDASARCARARGACVAASEHHEARCARQAR